MLNMGSSSDDIGEDLENFRTTIHGSFFLHISKDGNFYKMDNKVQRAAAAADAAIGDSRRSKSYYTTRYKSIGMHDSGNFSRMALERDTSKRKVNIMPIL